jgi:hypothetical protein
LELTSALREHSHVSPLATRDIFGRPLKQKGESKSAREYHSHDNLLLCHTFSKMTVSMSATYQQDSAAQHSSARPSAQVGSPGALSKTISILLFD